MVGTPPDSAVEEVHSGFCSILGLANVGKSTLLNQLLGKRLVAVSNKPQTTRNRIVGVKNIDGPPAAQIVFVDTPGVQHGKGPLRKYLRDEALVAAGDCDVALLMLDVSDPQQRSPRTLGNTEATVLLDALRGHKAPAVLVLNKIDRLNSRELLLPMIEDYAAAGEFAAIVPMAALSGDGTEQLCKEVAALLPMGPRLFPEEMYTDRAERFLAGELIREQLFRQLGDEVPYSAAVLIESFKERRDRGDVVISAVIHVERESQKGIVVGRGGQRIKAVGEASRGAISELLGCPVHVKLFVKVSKGWTRRRQGLRDMGYE